jgi:methyl-accepting chemotaxis protein
VAQAAQSTSASATDSQTAAKDLALMSTELRTLVGQFKVDANGHGKMAASSRGQ